VLYALATFLAASLGVAGAAAAITLSGMSAPPVQRDAISVGYRPYPYEDAYRWATEYYTALLHNRRPPGEPKRPREARPPREPDHYYVRDYYYDLPEYVWVSARRPSSCGEFHYWNGYCCVDARHYPPYVGPKW
jgi:hypothetical protein